MKSPSSDFQWGHQAMCGKFWLPKGSAEGTSLTLNGLEPEMLNVLQCTGQSFIINNYYITIRLHLNTNLHPPGEVPTYGASVERREAWAELQSSEGGGRAGREVDGRK